MDNTSNAVTFRDLTLQQNIETVAESTVVPTSRPKRQASKRINEFVAAEAALMKYPFEAPEDLAEGNVNIEYKIKDEQIEIDIYPQFSGDDGKPDDDFKASSSHTKPTTDDRYPCCYCTRTFRRLEGLEQHVVTHLKPQPHTCYICGSSFTLRQTLLVHMSTHSNFRPHACHVCPMAFSQKTKLKLHLRTHSGEKPYKCPHSGCGYASAQKGNLNVHIRGIHERNK